MTVRTELPSIVNAALKEVGFRRRQSNWYRLGPALYAIVNLQKSNWDDLVYVNVGFTPMEYLVGDWQPSNKCLVRFRVEALNSVRDHISLLDEGAVAKMGPSVWRAAVSEKIVGPLAVAVNETTDLEGLRTLLRDNVNKQVSVSVKVKQLLDAFDPD